MGTAQQPVYSRFTASRRRDNYRTIAFSAGTQLQPIDLPRTGMASAVHVEYDGSVTNSGATSLAEFAPYNTLSSIDLKMDLLSGGIIEAVPGYFVYLYNKAQKIGYAPNRAGVGDTTVDTDLYAAGVASGAGNTVKLHWELPISFNNKADRDDGLILLQQNSATMYLTLTCGALTDYAALTTANTGNFTIHYEYFDAPSPAIGMLPYQSIYQLIRTRQTDTLVQNSWFRYRVPAGGLITFLGQQLVLNGVKSNGFSQVQVVYGETEQRFIYNRSQIRKKNRQESGLNWENGFFFYDLVNAEGLPQQGLIVDAIDTGAAAQIEFQIYTTGTVTGTSYVDTMRRIKRVPNQSRMMPTR